MNKHVGVFAYKYTLMSCQWNTENILRRELTQLHVEIDSTLHYKYSVHTGRMKHSTHIPLERTGK